MNLQHRLPDEASAALNDLRTRIRSYVFREGIASLAVVIGLLFWATFLFDLAYFRVNYLELPRWIRAIMLISSIALTAAGAISWIVLRTYRSFRIKSLAMILERRFPELDDRLITAVEAAEGLLEANTPVTDAMLKRTLADVARTTRQLDLSSVFDSRPLRRAVTVAVGLMASILGLAVVDSSAMERWIAGYLELRDGYWLRETELIVRVVVQPGDRLHDFIDGRYRHPKGADLTLMIDVPPGKKPPDRIRLDNRMGQGLTQIYLTPASDGVFRHTFVELIEASRFWVSGGDYNHARPYIVDVVPPPEVKKIVLDSLYPDYTRMNEQESNGVRRTAVELKGSDVSLPMQTNLLMRVVANKPLRHARLEGDAGPDRWEIELTMDDSGLSTGILLLSARNENPQVRVPLPPLPAPDTQGDLANDRTTFSLPFILAVDGATALPDVIRQAEQSGQRVTFPLPLPPNGQLRLVLEDADGILSLVPVRFSLNAIVDQPPLIELKLKGIGTSITRKARIPVVGTIVDDYGIVSARFEYRIDNAPDWQIREFAVPPSNYPRSFVLHRSEDELFERFDIQPLDLNIKQRLTLSIAAIDGCTIPKVPSGTGGASLDKSESGSQMTGTALRGQGQKITFTIIPDEELLSILYVRELALRRRVEQVISEIKTALKDLQSQREKVADWTKLTSTGATADNEQVRTISQGMNASADRSLHSIRKNAVEMAGVETSFAEIREELINNAVDTPAILERIDDKILTPLQTINSKNFPDTDGALGLLKFALTKDTDPGPSLATSIDLTTQLIQNLERVLEEMAELARFDAVLEDLKKLIQSETELRDTTRRKLKEKAIKALE